MKKAEIKSIQLWDSDYPVSVTIVLDCDNDVDSIKIISDHSCDHPVIIHRGEVERFIEMIDEVKKYDSH